MTRDSLFGERIIWSGRPGVIAQPATLRAARGLLWVLSAVALSYALVLSLALNVSPAAMLLFAFWCSTLALVLREAPRLWFAKVEYIVTDGHVIWRRGPFRRSIERRSISFARIFWNGNAPGTGDIELVRAVPTGALRRRLMLRLTGVAAPDRVWAIVRGAENVAPSGGRAERPLSQRLDQGERVLWSAAPKPNFSAYLPHGRREWALLSIAGVMIAVVVQVLLRAETALEKVLSSGLPAASMSFVALCFGIGTSLLLVLAVAFAIAYDAVVRPGRAVKHTRYLITDKRVLIQRGHEELHLDRTRIVDVIDAPAGHGLKNVFLVLDGPRARALAASGAFGELDRGPNLRPVFESVADAESVTRILQSGSQPELPRAA